MNSPIKRVVYGALLASSTAFFLPTVLGDRAERPEPLPERSADGSEPAAAFAAGANESEGGSSFSDVAPTPTDSLGDLEQTLGDLEQLLPDSQGAGGGGGLIELWASRQGMGSTDLGSSEPERTALDAEVVLDEFLVRHPLRGLIHAETGSSALLAGLIVRTGDELGSGIQVTEISARGLVLECEGQTREVALPGLEMRARTRDGAPVGDSLEMLQEMEAGDAEPAE